MRSEIVAWVSKKTGPALRMLAEEADVASLLAATPIAVIGFYDSADATGIKVVSLFACVLLA